MPALYFILLAFLFGFVYTLFLGRYERKRIVEFGKTRDYCEARLNLYGTTLSAISDSIDLLEQKLVRVTYKIPDTAIPFDNSAPATGLNITSEQASGVKKDITDLNYTVQVASFKRRSDAERWQKNLAGALEQDTRIEPVELSNGRWFRVMVGRFASDSLALDFAKRLVARSVVNEYVIQIIR